jgi:uncharacterized protein involved in outer membrane biogenesis
VSSAKLLGAQFSGKLNRAPGNADWQWQLSADRLSSEELGLWLNPLRREGLLERVLPFLAGPPLPPELPRVNGEGKLSVGEWSMPPLAFQKLRANLVWQGERISLQDVRAALAGGTVNGAFQAQFGALPEYRADAEFHRVNVGQLLGPSALLRQQFAGSISGAIRLQGAGLSRAEFAKSLVCRGSADVRGAALDSIDLEATVRGGTLQTGRSLFPTASADFECGRGALKLDDLELDAGDSGFHASGNVTFSGGLDIRVTAIPPVGVEGPSSAAVLLTGTLANVRAVRP